MPRRRDVIRALSAAGIATVAGAGAVGTAVGDDHDDDPARVRVAHESPDAPAVDVFVAGEKALSGVPFGAVSEYLSVPAGSYDVQITAAGDPETVAFDGEVSVEAGTDYTVAAVGELSEGTFRPAVLRDVNRPFEGRTVVRAVHASPDAPAVDVTLAGGRYTLFHDLSFGDASDYRLLPAREFPVEVRPAGGGEAVASTEYAFPGERTVTLFAQGYLSPDDEPTDEAFALAPAVSAGRDVGDDGDDGAEEPAPAAVRVAHASPDAPAVDVFVAGEKALSGVSFGSITDYLSVPAGSYDVRITAAGDPETVAFDGEVSVEAGTDYTVAAVGELSEGTFRPTVLTDRDGAERGRAALRVLHASPDAPAVDVTTEHPATTLVDGLAFGEASGYASVRPGRAELAVRPDSAGDDNPFDAEFDATLRPGEAYTAIATGYFTASDEPADEQFDLAVTADGAGDH